MCSGMLKTKEIMTYFRHHAFYFLSFQNSIQTYSGDQGGSRQGGGRQRGGGVSHNVAGIILSASCSPALFCFMFV